MPLDLKTRAVGLEGSINDIVNRVNRRGLNVKVKASDFTQPLGRITTKANEFTKSLEASNARVIAFGASAAIIGGITTAFTQLVRQSIKLEKILTDINVVLGTSLENLSKFGTQLYDVARNTSQGLEVAAEAALEFSRQGLSMEEILRRTNDALILTRLTGIDAASAVSGLTAAVNGFADAGLTTTEIINKLASVDVEFAVSAEDLINALARAGAVAQDAGVNFDQLVGAVTSAQQITARGGAVIGNSFKTIFTRIQRSSTLDRLQELGVAVRDVRNNALPALQVLTNLAKSYDELGGATKAAVAEQVGGVFQINILRAALKDLSRENSLYAKATEISASATNEAQIKNEQLQQTISSLAAQTSLSIQELSANIGELALSPGISKILDAVKSFSDGLNTVLGGDGEGAGSDFAKSVLKGIGSVITGPGVVLAFGIFGKLFFNALKFAKESLKDILGIVTAKQKEKMLQDAIVQSMEDNKFLAMELNKYAGDKVTSEEIVLKLVQQQTKFLEKQKSIAASIAPGLAKRGVNPDLTYTAPQGRSNRSRGSGAFDGFIPNYSSSVTSEERSRERSGALKGGYSPGAIDTMNIKGLGSVVYNKAETVKKFPGMEQPAIMPPKSSKAGQKYQSNFGQKHGFDPYAYQGLIPNFADLRSRAQKIKDVLNDPANKDVKFTGKSYKTIQSKNIWDQEILRMFQENPNQTYLGQPLMGYLVNKGYPADQLKSLARYPQDYKVLSEGFVPNFALKAVQENTTLRLPKSKMITEATAQDSAGWRTLNSDINSIINVAPTLSKPLSALQSLGINNIKRQMFFSKERSDDFNVKSRKLNQSIQRSKSKVQSGKGSRRDLYVKRNEKDIQGDLLETNLASSQKLKSKGYQQTYTGASTTQGPVEGKGDPSAKVDFFSTKGKMPLEAKNTAKIEVAKLLSKSLRLYSDGYIENFLSDRGKADLAGELSNMKLSDSQNLLSSLGMSDVNEKSVIAARLSNGLIPNFSADEMVLKAEKILRTINTSSPNSNVEDLLKKTGIKDRKALADTFAGSLAGTFKNNLSALVLKEADPKFYNDLGLSSMPRPWTRISTLTRNGEFSQELYNKLIESGEALFQETKNTYERNFNVPTKYNYVNLYDNLKNKEYQNINDFAAKNNISVKQLTASPSGTKAAQKALGSHYKDYLSRINELVSKGREDASTGAKPLGSIRGHAFEKYIVEEAFPPRKWQPGPDAIDIMNAPHREENKRLYDIAVSGTYKHGDPIWSSSKLGHGDPKIFKKLLNANLVNMTKFDAIESKDDSKDPYIQKDGTKGKRRRNQPKKYEGNSEVSFAFGTKFADMIGTPTQQKGQFVHPAYIEERNNKLFALQANQGASVDINSMYGERIPDGTRIKFTYTKDYVSLDQKRTASLDSLESGDQIPDLKTISTPLQSSGFVPNFADPLQEAIGREAAAGVPKSMMKVEQDNSLISQQNPMGLAVTNRRDEPGGIKQGIQRAKKMGIDPQKHGASVGLVPNFANLNLYRGQKRDTIDKPTIGKNMPSFSGVKTPEDVVGIIQNFVKSHVSGPLSGYRDIGEADNTAPSGATSFSTSETVAKNFAGSITPGQPVTKGKVLSKTVPEKNVFNKKKLLKILNKGADPKRGHYPKVEEFKKAMASGDIQKWAEKNGGIYLNVSGRRNDRSLLEHYKTEYGRKDYDFYGKSMNRMVPESDNGRNPNGTFQISSREQEVMQVFSQGLIPNYIKAISKDADRKRLLKQWQAKLDEARQLARSGRPRAEVDPIISKLNGEANQIWSKISQLKSAGFVPNFAKQMFKFDVGSQGSYGKAYVGKTLKSGKLFLLRDGYPHFSQHMKKAGKPAPVMQRAYVGGKEGFWANEYESELRNWAELPHAERLQAAEKRQASFNEDRLSWQNIQEGYPINLRDGTEVRITNSHIKDITSKMGEEYKYSQINVRSIHDHAIANDLRRKSIGGTTSADMTKSMLQLLALPADQLKSKDVLRTRPKTDAEERVLSEKKKHHQIKWSFTQDKDGKKNWSINANRDAITKFKKYLKENGVSDAAIRTLGSAHQARENLNRKASTEYKNTQKQIGRGRQKANAGLAYDTAMKDSEKISTNGIRIKNLSSLIKDYNQNYANAGFVPNFAAAANIALAGGLVGKNKFGNINRKQLSALINSNPYFAPLMKKHVTWDGFPKNEKKKLHRWLLKQGISNRALQAYGFASMHSNEIGNLVSDLSMYGGHVPNFARGNAVDEAITREKNAGTPQSLIRVEQDNRLKSSQNPEGIGVTNLRDEPGGITQGITRAREQRLDPKFHGLVPNFSVRGRDGSGFSKAPVTVSIDTSPVDRSIKNISQSLDEVARKFSDFSSGLESVEPTISKLKDGKVTSGQAAREEPQPGQPKKKNTGSGSNQKNQSKGKDDASDNNEGGGSGGLDEAKKDLTGVMFGLTSVTYALEGAFADMEGKTGEYIRVFTGLSQAASQGALAFSALGPIGESVGKGLSGVMGTFGSVIGKGIPFVGAAIGAIVPAFQALKENTTLLDDGIDTLRKSSEKTAKTLDKLSTASSKVEAVEENRKKLAELAASAEAKTLAGKIKALKIESQQIKDTQAMNESLRELQKDLGLTSEQIKTLAKGGDDGQQLFAELVKTQTQDKGLDDLVGSLKAQVDVQKDKGFAGFFASTGEEKSQAQKAAEIDVVSIASLMASEFKDAASIDKELGPLVQALQKREKVNANAGFSKDGGISVGAAFVASGRGANIQAATEQLADFSDITETSDQFKEMSPVVKKLYQKLRKAGFRSEDIVSILAETQSTLKDVSGNEKKKDVAVKDNLDLLEQIKKRRSELLTSLKKDQMARATAASIAQQDIQTSAANRAISLDIQKNLSILSSTELTKRQIAEEEIKIKEEYNSKLKSQNDKALNEAENYISSAFSDKENKFQLFQKLNEAISKEDVIKALQADGMTADQAKSADNRTIDDKRFEMNKASLTKSINTNIIGSRDLTPKGATAQDQRFLNDVSVAENVEQASLAALEWLRGTQNTAELQAKVNELLDLNIIPKNSEIATKLSEMSSLSDEELANLKKLLSIESPTQQKRLTLLQRRLNLENNTLAGLQDRQKEFDKMANEEGGIRGAIQKQLDESFKVQKGDYDMNVQIAKISLAIKQSAQGRARALESAKMSLEQQAFTEAGTLETSRANLLAEQELLGLNSQLVENLREKVRQKGLALYNESDRKSIETDEMGKINPLTGETGFGDAAIKANEDAVDSIIRLKSQYEENIKKKVYENEATLEMTQEMINYSATLRKNQKKLEEGFFFDMGYKQAKDKPQELKQQMQGLQGKQTLYMEKGNSLKTAETDLEIAQQRKLMNEELSNELLFRDALSVKIAENNLALERFGETMANVSYDAVKDGLLDMIKSLSDASVSTGDAMLNFFGGIVQKISDTMLEAAVTKFTNSLFNAMDLDFGKPAGQQSFNTGGIAGYNNGGLTRAMSNNKVPAMLTAGEYVVRKKIVDRLGSGTMNEINQSGNLDELFHEPNHGLNEISTENAAPMPSLSEPISREREIISKNLLSKNQIGTSSINQQAQDSPDGFPHFLEDQSRRTLGFMKDIVHSQLNQYGANHKGDATEKDKLKIDIPSEVTLKDNPDNRIQAQNLQLPDFSNLNLVNTIETQPTLGKNQKTSTDESDVQVPLKRFNQGGLSEYGQNHKSPGTKIDKSSHYNSFQELQSDKINKEEKIYNYNKGGLLEKDSLYGKNHSNPGSGKSENQIAPKEEHKIFAQPELSNIYDKEKIPKFAGGGWAQVANDSAYLVGSAVGKRNYARGGGEDNAPEAPKDPMKYNVNTRDSLNIDPRSRQMSARFRKNDTYSQEYGQYLLDKYQYDVDKNNEKVRSRANMIGGIVTNIAGSMAMSKASEFVDMASAAWDMREVMPDAFKNIGNAGALANPDGKRIDYDKGQSSGYQDIFRGEKGQAVMDRFKKKNIDATNLKQMHQYNKGYGQAMNRGINRHSAYGQENTKQGFLGFGYKGALDMDTMFNSPDYKSAGERPNSPTGGKPSINDGGTVCNAQKAAKVAACGRNIGEASLPSSVSQTLGKPKFDGVSSGQPTSFTSNQNSGPKSTPTQKLYNGGEVKPQRRSQNHKDYNPSESHNAPTTQNLGNNITNSKNFSHTIGPIDRSRSDKYSVNSQNYNSSNSVNDFNSRFANTNRNLYSDKITNFNTTNSTMNHQDLLDQQTFRNPNNNYEQQSQNQTRGYSNGGKVFGSSGIDKVGPVLLDRGEFVVKASTVNSVEKQYPGFFDRLNSMKMKDGGMVSDYKDPISQAQQKTESTSSSGGPVTVNINVSSGGTTVEGGGAGEQEFASKIKQAVVGVIAQEKRVGGMLSGR